MWEMESSMKNIERWMQKAENSYKNVDRSMQEIECFMRQMV